MVLFPQIWVPMYVCLYVCDREIIIQAEYFRNNITCEHTYQSFTCSPIVVELLSVLLHKLLVKLLSL